MTMRLATDPDTGIRSLSTDFYRPAQPLPAHQVPTAEPLWTPPPPATLVIEDEAALRAALGERLLALSFARGAELAVAARVSVAVREKGEAQGRHAAAAEKTAAARREAASAMQAWLASQDTDRPGSEALSAALAAEAAASIDFEVMESVLGGLEVEHEHAIAETKRALHDAEMMRNRVVLAQACRMAAELNEADERALELRRSLDELFLALPVKLPAPAGIREAMVPKNLPFNASSGTPGVQRWSKLMTDLLADPQATVAPLGD